MVDSPVNGMLVESLPNHKNLKMNYKHKSHLATHHLDNSSYNKIALDSGGFKILSYDYNQQPFVEIIVSNGLDVCWNRKLRA